MGGKTRDVHTPTHLSLSLARGIVLVEGFLHLAGGDAHFLAHLGASLLPHDAAAGVVLAVPTRTKSDPHHTIKTGAKRKK